MNIFWQLVATIASLTTLIQQPLTQAYHIVVQPAVPATSTSSGLVLSFVPSVQQSAPTKAVNDSLGVAVTSQAAVVVDTASQAVLWEKNKDEQRAIGSITKLMTTLVFLQTKPDLDSAIEVIAEDQAPESKQSFEVGEQVKLKDVLASALIPSDNNAALILARSTGLSQADFVKRMNQEARTLGLTRSYFDDPTGLSSKNQSTASEVAVLAQKAFAQPEIRSLASLASYDFTAVTGQQHHLRSTNKIAKGFLQVTAAKTGYIEKAGHCLVAEVKDKGHTIITVSLGSATENDRFQDVKMLSYWIWHNYQWPSAT